MNNSKYRGVVVPMVTPVTQDGRLDVEAVKRIIDYLAKNGEMIPQDIKKPAFAGMNNVAQLFKGNTAEVAHIFDKVREVTNNGSEIA